VTGRPCLQIRSNLSPLVEDEAGRFLAALPDLREPVGRLRVSPATYGGEEITVFGPDDQVVLISSLALAIARAAAAARLGLRAPAPTSAR